jgi:hypothetical protein
MLWTACHRVPLVAEGAKRSRARLPGVLAGCCGAGRFRGKASENPGVSMSGPNQRSEGQAHNALYIQILTGGGGFYCRPVANGRTR